MKQLSVIVYITLSIQLLLSLLDGSSFHKYIKLFGYLIIMYVCFSVALSIWDRYDFYLAQKLYQLESLENDWMQWEVIGNE